MAGAGQLLRAGQARRTRAQMIAIFLPVGLPNTAGADPAIGESAVDDRAFDRFDRDRRIAKVQRASGLARRGADAAREFREIIGRMEIARAASSQFARVDEIVPIWDLIVDGAAIVTIGDAASTGRKRKSSYLL